MHGLGNLHPRNLDKSDDEWKERAQRLVWEEKYNEMQDRSFKRVLILIFAVMVLVGGVIAVLLTMGSGSRLL